MHGQLVATVRALLALTVPLGVAFPLLVTAVAQAAQVALDDEADGSLVRRAGVIVGSRLIEQTFIGDEWFQPWPSAAAGGYEGGVSGASNLGPSNDVLLDDVAARVDEYRRRHGLADDASADDAVLGFLGEDGVNVLGLNMALSDVG